MTTTTPLTRSPKGARLVALESHRVRPLRSLRLIVARSRPWSVPLSVGFASVVLVACGSKQKPTSEPPSLAAPVDRATQAGPVQALKVCPGTAAALADVLSGLALDHAVMDAATGLASASHQTREVTGLGAMFPALQDKGWRALLATPLATRAGEAPERLLAAGVRTDAVFEPFEAPPGPGFAAVLGCAAGGGYEVLALDEALLGDSTVQFFGVDVVPSGDGGAVTFVHLMFALPELMEFGLYSIGWGMGPAGKGAARVGEPMRFGEQVIFGSEHARSEPLMGSGWYPIDGDGERWRFAVLMGSSGPGDEEGQWVENVSLQPLGSLAGGVRSGEPGEETWMWLGRGAVPAACGTILHCTSLRDPQGGYFPWAADAPPYDWIAGAWTDHAPALADLREAGVDPSQGAWLIDSMSWYQRFDAQGEGQPLPKEAPVLFSLPRPGLP